MAVTRRRLIQHHFGRRSTNKRKAFPPKLPHIKESERNSRTLSQIEIIFNILEYFEDSQHCIKRLRLGNVKEFYKLFQPSMTISELNKTFEWFEFNVKEDFESIPIKELKDFDIPYHVEDFLEKYDTFPAWCKNNDIADINEVDNIVDDLFELVSRFENISIDYFFKALPDRLTKNEVRHLFEVIDFLNRYEIYQVDVIQLMKMIEIKSLHDLVEYIQENDIPGGTDPVGFLQDINNLGSQKQMIFTLKKLPKDFIFKKYV